MPSGAASLQRSRHLIGGEDEQSRVRHERKATAAGGADAVTRLATPVAPEPTTTGPPDFVGVGTQRSGTTWWFETLLGHPQIRGPKGRRKEQHFSTGSARTPLTDADIARYRPLPARSGQIAGEWTPRYMHDFWTPRLIARAAPDAKLLICSATRSSACAPACRIG